MFFNDEVGIDKYSMLELGTKLEELVDKACEKLEINPSESDRHKMTDIAQKLLAQKQLKMSKETFAAFVVGAYYAFGVLGKAANRGDFSGFKMVLRAFSSLQYSAKNYDDFFDNLMSNVKVADEKPRKKTRGDTK